MSMGGEGRVEVEYQAGKFVLILNDNTDAMKNYNVYDDHFQIGINKISLLFRSLPKRG